MEECRAETVSLFRELYYPTSRGLCCLLRRIPGLPVISNTEILEVFDVSKFQYRFGHIPI
jgi:hypothetical protein